MPELGAPIDPISWWLVHGIERSGTSYLMRRITDCARLQISDWGLRGILLAITRHRYGRLDKRRALKDLSANLLANANEGLGDQLDLVFKQASLRPDEYQVLVQMWGPPARIICCFREPAGTITSNLKKFPHHTVAQVQQRYIDQIQKFEQIGGDLFEYHERLTEDDYRAFLAPLALPSEIEPFTYRGTADASHVTPQIEEVYQEMHQRLHSQQARVELGAGSPTG